MSKLAGATRRALHRQVAAAQHDWRSPLVSVGIVREGELVWSDHVGLARVDPDEPGTDEAQFQIGSLTKTFTAVLVMALRDEGRLSLDDRLDDHLPGVAHGDLRLRTMLAHASGLQREPAGRIWESLDAPSDEQLLAQLDRAERVLRPHQAFHYSNLAYALLGQVIARVEGCSWEDALRRRVLDPLGMGDTGLTPQDATRALGYLVHPFSGTLTLEPRFELRSTGPVGGLWSTVADMARYAAFVAEPDERVLAAETLEEMCRPLIMTDTQTWTGAYGLGFGLTRLGDRVLAGHGGAMPGYLSGLQVMRRDNVGAIVFCNATAGPMPTVLAAALVATVLDAEPPAASPVWRPSAAHPELEAVLGAWWSEGEELRLEIRADQLWATVPGYPAADDTRFVPEGTGRFRAVEGRERGELLEVERDDKGVVERLYFASYPMTRAPKAFAQLSAELDEQPDPG